MRSAVEVVFVEGRNTVWVAAGTETERDQHDRVGEGGESLMADNGTTRRRRSAW